VRGEGTVVCNERKMQLPPKALASNHIKSVIEESKMGCSLRAPEKMAHIKPEK
jgi:hypothetical protein